MKNNLRNSCLVASILGIGLCHQASAVLVYDNSVNDLLIRFDPMGSEVGDEIILGGTERTLVGFDFEYWGTSHGSDSAASFDGLVLARVRFYMNDGPLSSGVPAPGGPSGLVTFYDSGLFIVPAPTDRQTFVFAAGADNIPAGGLALPNSFTWSVQFTTTDPDDHVGVDLYSPPVVGSNFPDYWQRDPITGNWSLQADPNGVVPYDFAARFNAVASVPETTGIGIIFMSFFGIVAFGWMTRRLQPA